MPNPAPLPRPTREAIANLPDYAQLPLSHIHLVQSPAEIAFATRELTQAGVIGFDTESKPVFTKETVGDGPHVVQLATLTDAFIVQINRDPPIGFLREVLESETIIKAGFGLASDRGPLQRKLGISLRGTVDLAQAVRKLGYRQAVGAKAAVAIVLGRRLPKPKGTTTSNWGAAHLRPNQLQYAANDAHAALAVYYGLGLGSSSPASSPV